VIGGSEDKVVPNIESDFESLSDQQNLMVEVIDGADHFFRDLYADDAVTLIVELIESL
jgi:alpha/beta superfamily hydrolase